MTISKPKRVDESAFSKIHVVEQKLSCLCIPSRQIRFSFSDHYSYLRMYDVRASFSLVPDSDCSHPQRLFVIIYPVFAFVQLPNFHNTPWKLYFSPQEERTSLVFAVSEVGLRLKQVFSGIRFCSTLTLNLVAISIESCAKFASNLTSKVENRLLQKQNHLSKCDKCQSNPSPNAFNRQKSVKLKNQYNCIQRNVHEGNLQVYQNVEPCEFLKFFLSHSSQLGYSLQVSKSSSQAEKSFAHLYFYCKESTLS